MPLSVRDIYKHQKRGTEMTREQFYTYMEQTFDSFTKTVIKTKRIDIFREYSRQAEREVSLSDMTSAEIGRRANVTDTYRLYRRAYTVRNYVIHVYDPEIGELLQKLTPQRRDVILLYYFLDLNDVEVGQVLHIDNTTAKYRRLAALKRLKKMMEEQDDE